MVVQPPLSLKPGYATKEPVDGPYTHNGKEGAIMFVVVIEYAADTPSVYGLFDSVESAEIWRSMLVPESHEDSYTLELRNAHD